jgi:regulator of sigma E protease
MSYALAILGFVILIVLHEAGHFAAAKAVGMRVERFFLFFPPRLISKRIGETEYGIGAIPLGGFVKITGMNPDEVEPPADRTRDRSEKRDILTAIESADSGPETPRSAEGPQPLAPEDLDRAYYRQPVWKRVLVIGAGPAVNIALAFAILLVLAFNAGNIEDRIGSVDTNSPAAAAGLRPGDRIVAVDGRRFADLNTEERLSRFGETVARHSCPGRQTPGCRASTPVELTFARGGRTRTVSITPRYDAAVARTRIGFSYATTPAAQTVPEAAGWSLDVMWEVSSKTISVIARLFEPEQREQVSGIVGATEVTRQAIDFGAREALFLVAIVSLSLGLINLFPFLPLDGGHIFWSLVEKVRGERVPFSVMERAGAVGFLLVIALFMVGLTNDIGRLTGEGFNVR